MRHARKSTMHLNEIKQCVMLTNEICVKRMAKREQVSSGPNLARAAKVKLLIACLKAIYSLSRIEGTK